MRPADRPIFVGVPDGPMVLVERTKLLDRLDSVVTRPFTMLTAPAGYGKSVLAAQWIRQRCPVPSAWLELGTEDSDPAHALARIVEVAAPLVGADVASDLGSLADRQRLSAERIALLSRTVAGSPDAVLVIDAMRTSGPAGLYVDLATALADAVDSGLHLLVIGRCTQPPAMTPLELRGAFASLEADDLRLSADELATVVEAYSGRPLDAGTAEILTARLGGWMAGAAIVAMSRQRYGAASADDLLVAAAPGIAGYYSSEVFDHLPSDVRTFLLNTSGADELSGELCDRLTGRTDGGAMLEGLLASGLPMRRGTGAVATFRYDTPFRAYLDARLRREDGASRSAGLRGAGDWYREQHRPLDAAEQYRRLGDWDAVVDVVMTDLRSIVHRDEISPLADFLAAVPYDVIRTHAELASCAGCVLMMDGRVAAARDLLSVVRPLRNENHAIDVHLIEADAAAWVEDVAGPLAAAEAALVAIDRAGDGAIGSHLHFDAGVCRCRAASRALAAGSYAGWWERARPHLAEIPADVAANCPQFQMVLARGQRALFMVLSGSVGDGLAEAERGLTIARETGLENHRFAADACFALGEGRRLAGRFDDAVGPLDRARELAGINRSRNRIAAATASQVHLLVDTGKAGKALEVIDDYRATTRHRAPDHLAALLAAGEARAVAALGDYVDALRIVEPMRHAAPAASVEVAVALAAGQVARARDVASNWQLDGSPACSMRRMLARALVAHAAGALREAVQLMRSALRVADRHQLLQPVVELGAPVTGLLRRVIRAERDTEIVAAARRAESLIANAGSTAPRFTPRELEVLAHLDRGLSLPAVGRELFLSVNTIKSHVKAIYRKLGASSRAEALAAWRGALPPSRRRIVTASPGD